MKKFKIEFYKDPLGEEFVKYIIIESESLLEVEVCRKSLCDKFNWYGAITEINK